MKSKKRRAFGRLLYFIFPLIPGVTRRGKGCPLPGEGREGKEGGIESMPQKNYLEIKNEQHTYST